MEKALKIHRRLAEHVKEAKELLAIAGLHEKVDYLISGIYLQGSQNYGTDREDSDVDSKLIVIPTIRSLILGRKFNYDFTVSQNEKVSVKTLDDFISLLWKGNINNLEILTTPHRFECGFVETLRKQGYAVLIPELVKGTLWQACLGMMIQKRKSVERGTETTRSFVERFGYDPKDAGHIVRIYALLLSLNNGVPFTKALNFKDHGLFSKYKEINAGVEDKASLLEYLDLLIEEIRTTLNKEGHTNSTELRETQDKIKEAHVAYVMQKYNLKV